MSCETGVGFLKIKTHNTKYNYVIETLYMWFVKNFLKKFSSVILNNPRRVKHSVNGYVKKEINHSKRNMYNTKNPYHSRNGIYGCIEFIF